jgi:hypothetical protein
MNIIGHEKFEPDAAKELARSIRLMQNWIDLTSHLLPKPEYSLPRRQIELPSRIGQHLDLPTKALLRNIGVVFLGDLNFNFDEDTLKKWLAYLLLFVAAISLTSGDFLTAILAGIAGMCLLNNW